MTAASNLKSPSDVLEFWFEKLKPEQQFKKDLEMDKRIEQEFGATLQAAAAGELWQWRNNMNGRLAEIIVLDQFSRNVYRDTPQSFAQDPLALALSQEAVARIEHREMPVNQRAFLYMPYMHSESLVIHQEAVKLFKEPGLEMNYDFELKHLAIIEKFGRYPHRNKILGRTSTPQELEFLKQPGSSF